MKESRKYRESSDFSDDDRHTHKYCRQAGHHRDKYLAEGVASHYRLAADDRHDQRKHGRHSRHRQEHIAQDGTAPTDRSSPQDYPIPKYSKSSDRGHQEHSIADMARHELRLDDRQSTTSQGHDMTSDSSDEILIKHRASRRLPRSSGGDDIARQIKNIEKAQREALRPSSTESHEIHVHYVPIVTQSASPPQMDHDNYHALSSASTGSENGGLPIRKSLAQGLSAKDVKGQLKDLTMSWFTKRSAQQGAHVRRSPPSPRRSKHERHNKHGKKKVLPMASTSKYLAPLAQRWVCYKCGKIRSDSIQDRHPLRSGKKMQPNWCGKCRVNGELKGRPLNWNGQRHYCWGCGIVRSEKYHCENPITEGERSTPNYCKRCRELSPSFDRNLRETSEIGSEIDLRDQAFRRQMYDADMSDIDEDEDYETTSAPGKENEDPNKPRKLKATRSFILKHGASATKTSSDSSFSSVSEGRGVPIDMLKAMHLDADRARGLASFKSEGFCLSGETYKPPSVESIPCADDIDAEMEDAEAHITLDGGNRSTQESNHHHDRHPSTVNKGCQTRSNSSAVNLTSTHHRVSSTEPAIAATTSNKKKVRWSENSSSRPATVDSTTGFVPQPYHSDSGFLSSGYRSDVSMRSASSARGRLHRLRPGEYSTGSPPSREGTAIPAEEDDGDNGEGSVYVQRRASELQRQGPQLNSSSSFAQGLPPFQGTFGDEFGDFIETGEGPSMPAFACEPTLSSYPCVTNNLPTPPDSHDQPENVTNTSNVTSGRGGNASSVGQWGLSSDQQVPNFSRPYQSPKHEIRAKTSYPAATSYVSSPGYGTRPDYIHHHYQQPPPAYPAFSSATCFSDSATRRDFSGYTAAPAGKDDPFNQEYMASSSSPDIGGGLSSYYHYEHELDMPFEGQGQQQHCHYPSGNDFVSFSTPHGYSAFDFSYIGCEETDSKSKFVRRNKADGSINNNAAAAARYPTTTPSRSQQPQQRWYLYEDEDANFEMYDSGDRENNYQWCDDRTTIHRSGNTAGPSLSSHHHPMALSNNQPRNTVTILSIREITSEEDLNGIDGEYSPHDDEKDTDSGNEKDAGASDLATVTQNDTPSIIYQA